MPTSATKTSGFTLVELAIVIVLIGVAMTLGLKTITATIENSLYSETKSKQERIKMALVSYLRTNGILPCPDNSGAAVVATGLAAAACSPAAANGYGIVPWRTLGISRETVVDGWGNYFSYRVANGSTGKNWTSIAVPATDMTINELKVQTDALTIQELNSDGTALVDVTKKAVVVIVSHGKNGFGAKTTKVGARMPTDDAGAGETTNATVGTTTFVLRAVTDVAAAFNGPYDDIATYMLPQDLLQPLVNEGTVKSCIAYCSSAVTSSCSNATETCACFGVGLQGVPAGTTPCSGAGICGICVAPVIAANCSPTGPIPVGATPANCL